MPAADIALRPGDFYSSHDIELMLGKEMIGLNLADKKVSFQDGESMGYDSLLLATGST